MKKVLVLSLSMIVVISFFLVACGSPTAAPPASTTSAAPAASVPAASSAIPASKVIELKFAYEAISTNDTSILVLEPWARAIEKATNNQVKITSYPNATLAKSADAYDATLHGIADLAWFFTGMAPGRFPLTEMVALPYLGFNNSVMACQTFQHLYDVIPGFKAEYSQVKILICMGDHPTTIGTTKKPILKLEDLAGLKLRVPGGPPTNWFKAAGAVPMSMAAADIYTNVEKGVIDGFNLPYAGSVGQGLHNICKYFTDVKFNCSTLIFLMNLDKWNSLPADVKAGIESVSGAAGAKTIGQGVDKGAENAKQKILDKGDQIQSLKPEELARWVDLAKPVATDFAKNLDAKGLEGSKTLNEIYKFVQEYK